MRWEPTGEGDEGTEVRKVSGFQGQKGLDGSENGAVDEGLRGVVNEIVQTWELALATACGRPLTVLRLRFQKERQPLAPTHVLLELRQLQQCRDPGHVGEPVNAVSNVSIVIARADLYT